MLEVSVPLELGIGNNSKVYISPAVPVSTTVIVISSGLAQEIAVSRETEAVKVFKAVIVTVSVAGQLSPSVT